MRENKVKKKLAQGGTALGAFMFDMATPGSARIAAAAGALPARVGSDAPSRDDQLQERQHRNLVNQITEPPRNPGRFTWTAEEIERANVSRTRWRTRRVEYRGAPTCGLRCDE